MKAFTDLQGQYLAYICAYTELHGVAPSEADMQAYFQKTPPSIHQMVMTLEKRGLIARTPRAARSIRVLVPPEQLPPLPHLGGARGFDRNSTLIRFAERILANLLKPARSKLPAAARDELVRCVQEALADEVRSVKPSIDDVRTLLSYRGMGQGLLDPGAPRERTRRVRTART